MKVENETYVFSSGRRCLANGGVVGIGPDLEIADGYDGRFYSNRGPFLSTPERIELADFMIGLWEAYKSLPGKE